MWTFATGGGLTANKDYKDYKHTVPFAIGRETYS